MLALTFGVPIVAPAHGPFLQLMEEGLAIGYDPSDPDGLLEALTAAPGFVEKVDRERMFEFVESLEGTRASDEFFSGLWSTLGRS